MLKKIKSLTDKYAIVTALVVFVLLDTVILVLGRLLSQLPQTLPIKYLIQSILIIVPVAFVFLFGFSSAFKRGNLARGLFCSLPFIVLQLLALGGFMAFALEIPDLKWNPWYLIIYGLFCVVGIAVREECVYRGVIQNIIAKKYANSVKGIWLTAIAGGAIFGLAHVTNLFFGMDPLAVLTQMFTTAFMGLFFCAVYLRSGSLWTLIIIHTLTDVSGLASSTFTVGVSDSDVINGLSFSWESLALHLFYGAFAFFLLRPSRCKQICESLCFADEKAQTDAEN